MTYFLYLENILNDKINTCSNNYSYSNGGGMYQKVITINHIPSGPLASYVKHVGVPKVSAFKYPAGEYCKNVIMEKNGQYYLTEQHLPELISFITENGYKIDESVNKIMHRNNNVATSSDKQFLFAFSE